MVWYGTHGVLCGTYGSKAWFMVKDGVWYVSKAWFMVKDGVWYDIHCIYG
jgi:hypothetical protein